MFINYSEVVQDCELLPDSLSLVTHDNELIFGTAIEEFEATNEPFDDLKIECIYQTKIKHQSLIG